MRHPDPRTFRLPGRAEPFPRKPPSGFHVTEGAGREADPAGPCAVQGEGLGCDPAIGVERRLVRRAEALWDRLRAGRRLPAADCARAFGRAPFAANALVVAFPPHPGSPGGDGPEPARRQQPCLLEVGEGLALLGLAPGPVPMGDGAAGTVADEFITLAARAAVLAEPVLLERDSLQLPGDPARPADGLGAMLMRAVALPFAPPAGAGPLAVVVVSWRRLLSEAETARLARELESAVGALHRFAD